MTSHNPEISRLQPEIVGDQVVVHHWQRGLVKRVLTSVADEGFLPDTSLPKVDERGATSLSAELAAYLALGMGVLAEDENDSQRRPFMEQRALIYGQAALQAGLVQEPPFAEVNPLLHFELEDMVAVLQQNVGNQSIE